MDVSEVDEISHAALQRAFAMSNSNNETKLSSTEKRDVVIQAALQMIPYVGSSLATLYFGAKQERRFTRLETFYREVAQEAQALKGKIASVQEHDEEALAAIIEELNENVEREHVEKKRFFLKCYLKNTLIYPIKNNYDERLFFLDTLGTMTLLECELLIDLHRQKQLVKVESLEKLGANQYAIVGAINRLKSYGFLKSGSPTWDGIGDPLKETVELSHFGRRFCEFCLNF